MKKYIFTLLLLTIFFKTFAQIRINKNLQLNGYVETYYAINTGIDSGHNQTDDVYSFNKNKEFNVNLAMLKLAYTDDKIRSNIALMFGTYPNANMASETATMKNIMEANVGIKLSKKNNFWLDAGILPSHIGVETAIGKDNATLTRSLLADNSPYFETGARLSYATKNNKWNMNINVLNGWQNIAMPTAVNSPSTGVQITYKPNENVLLNYSNFYGQTEAKNYRFYNDLFIDWKMKKAWEGILSADYGYDNYQNQSPKNWEAISAICKKTWQQKHSIAMRVEYFDDINGVMLRSGNGIINRRQLISESINYDYQITANALWRIEAKNVQSMGALWQTNGHNNYAIFTNSLSLFF